jgi:hypothetical protein
LKVLEGARLIARGRQAQWRPCTLEAEPLKDVSEWVEQYRRFWEQRFDRLETYLAELKAGQSEREPGSKKKGKKKKEKDHGRRQRKH